MKKTAAFTLIELLMAIAIIGIISSLAYPSYLSYQLKTHRGVAKMTLIKAQLRQSSLFILNPNYSDDKNVLGLIDSDNYLFTIITSSATSYLIKATARGQQVKDSGCTILTIDQTANNPTPIDCW